MTIAKSSLVYEWQGYYPDKESWQILTTLLAKRGIRAWHCRDWAQARIAQKGGKIAHD